MYRALAPLVAEVVAVLEDLAQALRERDLAAAERVLLRARGVSETSARFDEALGVAMDTTRSVPPRWGARGRVAEFAAAGPHVDLAVRDVRVLARGVVRAVDLEAAVPAEVPDALERLARGVACLGEGLGEPERRERARAEILRAAGLATRALEGTSNMSVSAIVAQVRATAVDLLRGLGADRGAALDAVRSASHQVHTGAPPAGPPS